MFFYDYMGTPIPVATLEERDYHCAFSLYPRIAVCGDSYANGYNGETEGDDSSTANHPSMSWPAILARRNGIEVASYSWGGMSTRSFISNSQHGLPMLESDPAHDLYILALERNDYNYKASTDASYLGTIADITGSSLGSYPDTFYGNYATIIERIQAHAPDARIVMMSGDYVERHEASAFNFAMQEIAEEYGLPCMVQMDDEFFAESNTFYRTKTAGGHPAPAAYAGMAMAIERLFDRCVGENRSYFDYYHTSIQQDVLSTVGDRLEKLEAYATDQDIIDLFNG